MSAPVEKWNYADVSLWLRQIGLGKYAELFAKHEINGEILITMKEKDLSLPPLNIVKFGVTRKFGLKLEELRKTQRRNNADQILNQKTDERTYKAYYENKTRSAEIFSSAETETADVQPEHHRDSDRASDLEKLFPDFCWRYSEPGKYFNNDGLDATVVVSISPSEFYVQPIYVVPQSQQLLSNMNNFYTTNVLPVPAKMVFVNMPCAVNYRDDPGWYRAVVREKGRDKVRVAFVDWGNCQISKFSDIKPLTKHFGQYPPLAVRCRIDGIGDLSTNQKVVKMFLHEIESVKMLVKIMPVSFDDNDGVVNVRLLNYETGKDIGAKYISNVSPTAPNRVPFVEMENLFTQIKPKPVEKEIGEKIQVYGSDMEAFLNGVPGFDDTDTDDEEKFKPRTKKLKQIKREILLKVTGKMPCNDVATFYVHSGVQFVQEYPKQSKRPKGAVAVVVTEVVSAKEIYLRSEEQRNCLNILENLLKKTMDKIADDIQIPDYLIKHGTACVYKNFDGRWFRAKFGDTDPKNDQTPLILVDYGPKLVTVDRANRSRIIKPLPTNNKMFSTEFHIYKCKIHKLCSSPMNADEIQLLKELLPENEKITAYFVHDREPYRVHLESPTTMMNFTEMFEKEFTERRRFNFA